jgi:hypothetical protein
MLMNTVDLAETSPRRWGLYALIAAVGLVSQVGYAGEATPDREQSSVIVGYGVAGIFNDQKASGALFEWRSPAFWHSLRGWTAANIATQGAYFAGIGLYYGVPLGKNWEVGISSGPGFFRPDRRLNLGDSLEFRSNLECSYRFRSGQRLGLRFGHISNASLGRVNPGSEFVQITWQVPLPLPGFASR